MDYGEWTENSRGTYNKWDGIARSTIQVCYEQIFMLHHLNPLNSFGHLLAFVIIAFMLAFLANIRTHCSEGIG